MDVWHPGQGKVTLMARFIRFTQEQHEAVAAFLYQINGWMRDVWKLVLNTYGAASRVSLVIERVMMSGWWTIGIRNALDDRYFHEEIERIPCFMRVETCPAH